MQIHNSTEHTACHKLTKDLKFYVISLLGFLVIGLACRDFEYMWAIIGALECNVLDIKRAFAKRVT